MPGRSAPRSSRRAPDPGRCPASESRWNRCRGSCPAIPDLLEVGRRSDPSDARTGPVAAPVTSIGQEERQPHLFLDLAFLIGEPVFLALALDHGQICAHRLVDTCRVKMDVDKRPREVSMYVPLVIRGRGEDPVALEVEPCRARALPIPGVDVTEVTSTRVATIVVARLAPAGSAGACPTGTWTCPFRRVAPSVRDTSRAGNGRAPACRCSHRRCRAGRDPRSRRGSRRCAICSASGMIPENMAEG